MLFFVNIGHKLHWCLNGNAHLAIIWNQFIAYNIDCEIPREISHCHIIMFVAEQMCMYLDVSMLFIGVRENVLAITLSSVYTDFANELIHLDPKYSYILYSWNWILTSQILKSVFNYNCIEYKNTRVPNECIHLQILFWVE